MRQGRWADACLVLVLSASLTAAGVTVAGGPPTPVIDDGPAVAELAAPEAAVPEDPRSRTPVADGLRIAAPLESFDLPSPRPSPTPIAAPAATSPPSTQAARLSAAPPASRPPAAPAASPAPSASPRPRVQQPAKAPMPSGSCDVQCRGERVQRQSPVDPPPGWEVRFEEARDDVLGTTSPAERRIRIFVRQQDPDAALLFTLLHEYGHAYDIDYFDRSRRRTWADARGYDYDRWAPSCDECNDLYYPAGDWAESFAYCHTGDAGRFDSRMAGVPTADQCDLLHRLSLPPGHPDAPPSEDHSRCRGNLLGRRCR